MYDKELAFDILKQIQAATETILERFASVNCVNDYTDSPEGMEKLDAACMLLIVIGESIKNLDKITSHSLLSHYPQIDWKKAKGLRDIITHHYFDINAEAIFDVCKTKMEPLLAAIKQIIKDIE